MFLQTRKKNGKRNSVRDWLYVRNRCKMSERESQWRQEEAKVTQEKEEERQEGRGLYVEG